jgi:hypothetical protein
MLAVAATPGECPFARFVWSNRAPPRVQFFAWLLVQDRIQSRQNLHRKTNVQQQDAACALCGHPEESADHIIFACPTAAALWHHVGVPGVIATASSSMISSHAFAAYFAPASKQHASWCRVCRVVTHTSSSTSAYY